MGSEVKTTHSLSYPPNLIPLRVQTTMNYNDYGRSAPHPQEVVPMIASKKTLEIVIKDCLNPEKTSENNG